MRKVALAALLGGACLSFACTALLGDFQVDPSAGPNPNGDGGVDGTPGPGDGDGGADAPDEAAVAALKCGIPEPIRTIEEVPDVNGQPSFDRELRVFRAGRLVRVFGRKMNTQTTGSGTTIYSFDPDQGVAGSPLAPAPYTIPGAQVLDVRRAPSPPRLAMLLMQSNFGAPANKLFVQSMDDSDPGRTLTAPMDVVQPFPISGGFGNQNISGALGVYLDNSEYFWAVSMPWHADPSQQAVYVGHRTQANPLPAPLVLFTGPPGGATGVRDMARSGNHQYIFNDKGPESGSPTGTSYWDVQDDNIAVGGLKPKSMTAPGSAPVLLSGVSSMLAPGLRAAVIEVDFAATNPLPVLRIGDIAAPDLAAINGSKLPEALKITSLTEAPVDRGESRFYGDDFLMVGTPDGPDKGKGVNFLWYDVTRGGFRGRQVGADRFIANRNISAVAISVGKDPPNGLFATFDLVFIESKASGTAGTAVTGMYYAKVSCSK